MMGKGTMAPGRDTRDPRQDPPRGEGRRRFLKSAAGFFGAFVVKLVRKMAEKKGR